MSNQDAALISEAREWEAVAEALDYQSSIFYTVADAMRLHAVCDLSSTLKLVEKSADDIYDLFQQCQKKQQEIYAQTAGGKAQ